MQFNQNNIGHSMSIKRSNNVLQARIELTSNG